MDLNVADGKVVKVTSPPPGETLNDGNLCVKGRFAYDFIHHEERLTTPLIRVDGELQPASWEEALAKVHIFGLHSILDLPHVGQCYIQMGDKKKGQEYMELFEKVKSAKTP